MPIWSGYRGAVVVRGEYWDAIHVLRGAECAEPGSTVDVDMNLLFPEHHVGCLAVGDPFDVCEGPHVVAVGIVTEVMPALSSCSLVTTCSPDIGSADGL